MDYDVSFLEIPRDNEKYPSRLHKLKNPPRSVFIRGESNILDYPTLGIVGSRYMSEYARISLEKIAGPICSAGITIVSGFMYGVDAAAHSLAIKNKCKTIAVMACGIDQICPTSQADLYDKITHNGAIVTEYPPGFKARKWTFPRRNRIIAGLSDALLVVEADEKSGSLITASVSLSLEKKVFVIPQNINAKNSLGIVKLLNLGAYAISDSAEILKFFNCEVFNVNNNILDLSEDTLETKILDFIQQGGMSNVDSLCKEMNYSVNTLTPILYELILKGKIIESDGSFYAC